MKFIAQARELAADFDVNVKYEVTTKVTEDIICKYNSINSNQEEEKAGNVPEVVENAVTSTEVQRIVPSTHSPPKLTQIPCSSKTPDPCSSKDPGENSKQKASKRYHTVENPSAKMPEIIGIPRKAKKKEPQEIPNARENTCKICSIVFSSPEDIKMKHKFSAMNLPIVCGFKEETKGQDKECTNEDEVEAGCDYWVHVRCTGHNVRSRPQVAKIQFFCPDHAPSKKKD
eukprot:TCONS_00042192-protein